MSTWEIGRRRLQTGEFWGGSWLCHHYKAESRKNCWGTGKGLNTHRPWGKAEQSEARAPSVQQLLKVLYLHGVIVKTCYYLWNITAYKDNYFSFMVETFNIVTMVMCNVIVFVLL